MADVVSELFLLVLLLPAIELSLGGSSPYTSTDKTNKNKYTQTKNTVQTIQNTINTSIHITKTPTLYKTHTYTHPHIRKQVTTATVQVQTTTVQVQTTTVQVQTATVQVQTTTVQDIPK